MTLGKLKFKIVLSHFQRKQVKCNKKVNLPLKTNSLKDRVRQVSPSSPRCALIKLSKNEMIIRQFIQERTHLNGLSVKQVEWPSPPFSLMAQRHRQPVSWWSITAHQPLAHSIRRPQHCCRPAITACALYKTNSKTSHLCQQLSPHQYVVGNFPTTNQVPTSII